MMDVQARLKDAWITALIAALLALPLAGVRTEQGIDGMVIDWRLGAVAVAAGLVFVGRLCWGLAQAGSAWSLLAPVIAATSLAVPWPSQFLQTAAVGMGIVIGGKFLWVRFLSGRGWFSWNAPLPNPSRKGEGIPLLFGRHLSLPPISLNLLSCLLILAAIIFPFTPLASRYALDVSIMVLTYIMLAWGLNITVGFAGLLDLGFAGFYALGAYGYALLAQRFGIGFWTCLPLAGVIAAVTGLILGAPVLRLRGDYFAVVTLGFGEIVRLVLINWTDLTGGPNGMADIPRPTLFGLQFARQADAGHTAFNDYFHIAFEPMQRVWFLYYIILALALAVGWFGARLRRLPLGRAWESFREDEIACASLGIDRTWIKLAAYSLAAMVAGLAGAFFAARQGFVSPESFTFTESATILAIVILGGVGHPLGIALAALFIIGLPELFRGFEQYRMLAFGLGMVLIMVWRPGGMMAARQPTARLSAQPRAAAE